MAALGETLNFNVGVLGHIDSGKTSLAKALSTTASTAAFDKNPQSRERGITLDLGFSSFTVQTPEQLSRSGYTRLQFTLVDCPGHASLIRTIIGGAQIIDLMMLVIDVTKGMQTQSAECLVIGQIACNKMVVVLNKTDLLPENKRPAAIERMTKKMQKTLENTKFHGCPIISVAAKPGGPEAPESESAQGISELIELLKSQAYLPRRDPSGPFLMAVDHCFSMKGQGTVMTGTILSGSVSLNDNVEIPALKVSKKVKSMQMFHQPVPTAMQGDRLGICVTQFDPKLLERGLVCTPDSLQTIHAAVISVKKIAYFKGSLHTKAKFHITLGHETVMGKVMFFSVAPPHLDQEGPTDHFDFGKEYLYQDSYVTKDSEVDKADGPRGDELLPKQQWALLEFEKPVTCPRLCLVIGSKLDTDIHSNTCRLAFHGVLLEVAEEKNYSETFLPKLKIFKMKRKEGQVERVNDDYSVIGRSLFKKETNIQLFVGLKVTLSTGEEGAIEGSFGQSGKFKVRIPNGLQPETKQVLGGTSKKKSKASKGDAGSAKEEESRADGQPVLIVLAFKRYVFDPQKKMIQS
ncbi:selenocysteine-specific elongation factor [Ranitomeya variabilis]|uniref:selenocysteine-specific elongation factor n=1 Tax=Ranitomeya variabilis TaxID=490064 RepID=UPI0040579C47